jgi:hypothetical protein
VRAIITALLDQGGLNILDSNRYPHAKHPCHFEGAGAHPTAIRETCFVFTPDPSLRLKCGSGQDDAKGSAASKAAELRSADSPFDFAQGRLGRLSPHLILTQVFGEGHLAKK